MAQSSTGQSSSGPSSDIEARPARRYRDPPVEFNSSSAAGPSDEESSVPSPGFRTPSQSPASRRPQVVELLHAISKLPLLLIAVIGRRVLLWHSQKKDDRLPREFRYRNVDVQPAGYPLFAAYMSSDPNYLIYRRFGYLRQRLLLQMERELFDMERRLDVLDKDDVFDNPEVLKSSNLDEQISQGLPRRRNLFEKMEAKIKAYDDLLLRTERVYQLNPPTSRNINSLLTFIENNHLFTHKEHDFLFEKEDLISLADGLDDNRLNGFVEDALHKLAPRLSKMIFQTKEQGHFSKSEYNHYYSKRRIDTFIIMMFGVFSTICVIVPVLFLYNEHLTNGKKLRIVVASTLIFAFSLPLLTRARRHEVMVATATYCAVLVAFVANAQATIATAQALAER